MPSRWQRARQETPGLQAWKRRLGEAGIVAVATYIGLRLWGSEDGSTDQVIVAAVALPVSFLLLPLLSLGWHYLWAPWSQLKEEVAMLREAKEKGAETPSKTVNVRLTLRNQARVGRDLLKKSAHLGPYALQANAATAWTDDVVPVLAKYCGSDSAEAFLDAGDPDETFQKQLASRIEKLEEIAADSPTNLKASPA